MASLPDINERWHGLRLPPLGARRLTAGPLEVQLVGVDLRHVVFGHVEVVRRLYMVVRDANWATIAPSISEIEIEDDGDAFRVDFMARNWREPIDFLWRGVIEGSTDGTITYSMRGAARSAFCYNKIHLCVHHPILGAAGRPFRAETPGGCVTGRLPTLVGQQYLNHGTAIPLFPAFSALTVDASPEMEIRFEFEGDLWETEDHRNWTDASFKTYGTPEALGVQEMTVGQHISQLVRVHVDAPSRPRTSASHTVRLSLGDVVRRPRPRIGLQIASHGRELSRREGTLLDGMNLDHLRVDLRLARDNWMADLDRFVRAQRALDLMAELAVFVDSDDESALARLRDHLVRAHVPIARVLVFGRGAEVSDRRQLLLARRILSDVATVFVAGTDFHFCELNRHRPRWLTVADGVTFSITPQVHADDDWSLVENLEGQAEVVRCAQQLWPSVPVAVGSVTLRPRFNLDAQDTEVGLAPREFPDEVDPRQASLLGAGWTLASYKTLAESGVRSVTFYETTGWRGVMECEDTTYRRDYFPSLPGGVFPLYHVLRDIGEHAGEDWYSCSSSTPSVVDAVAWAGKAGPTLLVANLTSEGQQVAVEPLADQQYRVRRLTDETWEVASARPLEFRTHGGLVTPQRGHLSLRLDPFETLCLQRVAHVA